MRSMIRTWQRRIFEWSVKQGFWPHGQPVSVTYRVDRAVVIEKLCLIHSEVSEALEEIRAGHEFTERRTIEGKPEGFGVELADTVIRIFDLAEACSIDLESEIDRKMDYNRRRPFRHGKLL